MDPEKREGGIGDGVDQAAHKVVRLRRQLIVLPAEGYDLDFGIEAAHAGDSIALKAAAVDQRRAFDIALRGVQNNGTAASGDLEHSGGGADLAAPFADDVRVTAGDLLVIDDSRLAD